MGAFESSFPPLDSRYFSYPKATNSLEYDLFRRITSQEVKDIWLRKSPPPPEPFEEEDDSVLEEVKSLSNLVIDVTEPVLVTLSPCSAAVGAERRSASPDLKPPLPPPILEIHGEQYRSYRDLVKKDSILHDLPPEDQRTFICVFCKANDEPSTVYTAHPIRIDGVVSCPYLRVHVCQLCKATGNEAHTIKYCLKNRRGFFATKAREKDQLTDENDNYMEEPPSTRESKAVTDETKVVKKRTKEQHERRGKAAAAVKGGKGAGDGATVRSDGGQSKALRTSTNQRRRRERTRHPTPPRFKNSKRSAEK